MDALSKFPKKGPSQRSVPSIDVISKAKIKPISEKVPYSIRSRIVCVSHAMPLNLPQCAVIRQIAVLFVYLSVWYPFEWLQVSYILFHCHTTYKKYIKRIVLTAGVGNLDRAVAKGRPKKCGSFNIVPGWWHSKSLKQNLDHRRTVPEGSKKVQRSKGGTRQWVERMNEQWQPADRNF